MIDLNGIPPLPLVRVYRSAIRAVYYTPFLGQTLHNVTPVDTICLISNITHRHEFAVGICRQMKDVCLP